MRRSGSMALLSVVTWFLMSNGVTPSVSAAPISELRWGACPPEAMAGSAECVTVQVPMDYAVPERGQIELTLSRMPAADPGTSRGTLFAGSGGPGVDALNFWSVRDARVPGLREFDRIAVQPRGLRWSTPLRCGRTTAVIVPVTDRSSCEAAAPGYPATITTETLVRDLDQVRGMLGIDRISFYGGSYGTAVGATYATLFPERVDKMVLDANVNPEWEWIEQQAAGWQSREAAVSTLFDWIAANDAVYQLGATRRAVAGEWARQVDAQGGGWQARLDPALGGAAGALPEAENLPPGELSGRVANLVQSVRHPGVSPSPTQAATDAAVYWRNYWPYVAEGMRRYRADPRQTEFLTYLANRLALDPTSGFVHDAINCNESSTRPDPATAAAMLAEFASGGSYFQFAAQLQRSGMLCSAWPSSARRIRFDGSRLAVRPLIVQTTADAATPAAGGPAMAAALRGTLMWVDGTDHGSFARYNSVVDQAILHYLGTGEVTHTQVPAAPITTPQPPATLPDS
ncbi:alpha/beta hydrolase [Nocardia sp. NPDC051832]|uniref:alpha/beta hydrolase n=1 Tax=Nocardia sp. NPDC051832 TaxID=3155673 RepID=UPI0034165944